MAILRTPWLITSSTVALEIVANTTLYQSPVLSLLYYTTVQYGIYFIPQSFFAAIRFNFKPFPPISFPVLLHLFSLYHNPLFIKKTHSSAPSPSTASSSFFPLLSPTSSLRDCWPPSFGRKTCRTIYLFQFIYLHRISW